MRLVQAVMALILSAILIGVVAGIASANVPGIAINVPPGDAMIKAVVTHGDAGSPALHYVDQVRLHDQPDVKYLQVRSSGVITSTAQGVPASAVTIPYAAGSKSGRGTIGTSNKVALSDDLRYAGRGPGLVDTTTVLRPATAAPAWTPGQPRSTIVQAPASAPGPNSRPMAFVVCRVCHR